MIFHTAIPNQRLLFQLYSLPVPSTVQYEQKKAVMRRRHFPRWLFSGCCCLYKHVKNWFQVLYTFIFKLYLIFISGCVHLINKVFLLRDISVKFIRYHLLYEVNQYDLLFRWVVLWTINTRAKYTPFCLFYKPLILAVGPEVRIKNCPN